MSSSVPLIPRCNVDDLLLAIESTPPKSASTPVSRSGQRSQSASVGSGSLVKCSPLPPIQSNSSRTDNAAAAAADDAGRLGVRPSSAHVAGSSQTSRQQLRDEPPPESFFMTEVLTSHMSPRC